MEGGVIGVDQEAVLPKGDSVLAICANPGNLQHGQTKHQPYTPDLVLVLANSPSPGHRVEDDGDTTPKFYNTPNQMVPFSGANDDDVFFRGMQEIQQRTEEFNRRFLLTWEFKMECPCLGGKP